MPTQALVQSSVAPLVPAHDTWRRELRLRMRAARRGLNAKAQAQAARAVARRIARAYWFHRARRIAFYVGNDGELDPSLLLAQARRRDIRCFLPILIGVPIRMRFVRVANRRLAPRRFGILAPRGASVPAYALDLLLLPVVAFDRDGGRLGRGGGYYDQALAARSGRPQPLRVGLAHSLQEAAQLPLQDWDVRLSLIVTPDELIAAKH